MFDNFMNIFLYSIHEVGFFYTLTHLGFIIECASKLNKVNKARKKLFEVD